MSDEDFREIFENGYELIIEGEESELTCLECGARTEMKEDSSMWSNEVIIECINKHKEELLVYATEWTNITNGLLKMHLENNVCLSLRPNKLSKC